MADTPARYKGLGESTTGVRELTDEEYRLFIRARIKKNSSRGTINEVIEAVKFITGVNQVELVDGELPATIRLNFTEELDTNTRTFLRNNDLIPKPAGVLLHMVQIPPNPFGFAGANGGDVLGYDLGTYAEII
jgi:hypothetical protein